MNSLNQVSEKALDSAIDSVGPYTGEYLEALLTSDEILESTIAREGIIRSLAVNARGRTFDGLQKFDIAHPYTYDMVASESAGDPRSRKRTNGSSPATFHVGLSVPDRIDLFTGNYDYRKLSAFTLSVCGRVAEVAGSEVVVTVSDNDSSRVLTEGTTDELVSAYPGIIKGEESSMIDQGDPGTKGLIDLIGRDIKSEEDAVYLVSDFTDGYDKENDEYDWENSLDNLSTGLGDKLWVIQLKSPSQGKVPAGLYKNIGSDAIRSMNRRFEALHDTKTKEMQRVFAKLQRTMQVDLFRVNNPDNPARMITNYVLGEKVQ